MNINEQMNHLGQIGSVGYAPSDDLIDELLGRTRRARAVRQGSAALVGSVSAVGLGVLGAQIFVAFNDQEDPAFRDRNLIENDIPSLFDFKDKFGEGYTGTDEATKDRFTKIYEELDIAAKLEAKHLAEQKAAEEAAKKKAEESSSSSSSCTYEEHPWEGGVKYRSPETNCQWVYPESDVPDGWIEFAGIEAQCKTYTDAATGSTFFAAHVNAGDWRKMVNCVSNGDGSYHSGDYRYIYKYGDVFGSLSGTTCTGTSITKKGAPHQYSCNPKKDEWILSDPANFKWLSECGQYYDIRVPSSWPEGWSWTGSSWTYTEPTPDPPPDPEPSSSPSP